jgi:hypothetical protein
MSPNTGCKRYMLKSGAEWIKSYVCDVCLFSLEGLFLLQHFIEQCASSSLSDAALSWIGQLTNILKSYETTVVHRVSCNILSTLLAEIRPLNELSHEASTSHVPQVIQAMLGAKEPVNIPVLLIIHCSSSMQRLLQIGVYAVFWLCRSALVRPDHYSAKKATTQA